MRETARRLVLTLYNIDHTYCLNEGKRRLSDAELSVMYALDDGKPHSQKEISREWLVPKTSVNSIVKRWEREGLLTLVPVPGKRREMHIVLTDAGKEYAKGFMGFLYRAEDAALKRTMERYSPEFVDALEFYAACLKESFDDEQEAKGADNGLG